MKYKVKQICYFVYYILIRMITLFVKRKNIWIIMDRKDSATDNGYFLFKYIKNNHPEIKVYFVLEKKYWNSYDIPSEYLIDYGSFTHILYILKCKFYISSFYTTTGLPYAPNLIYKTLKLKHKIIYLQHGITKDTIDSAKKKKGRPLDLFISGARPEYQFLLENSGYDENVIKYTGLARFDNLHENENVKNKILIMPTFRNYLQGISEKDFLQTDFYLNWNNLINDNKLLEIAEEKNIEIILFLHNNFQMYSKLFKSESKRFNILDNKDINVQDILIDSKILITDYSSVFFDFAYMGKPVVYYHFDYDQYRQGHYKEGYFDYKSMGFGKVVKSHEKLICEILKIIDNGYTVEEEYVYNSNIFFELKDTSNSKRIVEEIKKIDY